MSILPLPGHDCRSRFIAPTGAQYLGLVKGNKPRSWISRLLRLALALLALLYLFWTLSLVALRFVNPATTGVQIQRRVEANLSGRPYRKRYKFVPLQQISPNLMHAVIAAED